MFLSSWIVNAHYLCAVCTWRCILKRCFDPKAWSLVLIGGEQGFFTNSLATTCEQGCSFTKNWQFIVHRWPSGIHISKTRWIDKIGKEYGAEYLTSLAISREMAAFGWAPAWRPPASSPGWARCRAWALGSQGPQPPPNIIHTHFSSWAIMTFFTFTDYYRPQHNKTKE